MNIGCIGTGLFALTAVICSYLSAFWCRTVEFRPFGISTIRPLSLQFGAFSYRSYSASINSSGNSINVFETCSPYPDYVEINSYWKTARVFNIIAPVLGTILAMLACASPKLPASATKCVGMTLMIFITTSQGLTLLILKSNLCTEIPLTNVPTFFDDTCEMSVGSYLSIAASVCWFLAGLTLIAGGSSSDNDGMNDEDD